MDQLLEQAQTIYEGEIVCASTRSMPVLTSMTNNWLPPLGLRRSTARRDPHLRLPVDLRYRRFSSWLRHPKHLPDTIHRLGRHSFDIPGRCPAVAVLQSTSTTMAARKNRGWSAARV